MAQPKPQTQNAGPQGADKRAYPRTSVRLAATCVSKSGGARRACEIRNFCPGGLLLNFAVGERRDYLPVAGDIIEIISAWPEGPDRQQFSFTARVVHAAPDSAGVALIKHDPTAHRILIRCSETQRGERRLAVEPADDGPDAGNAGTLLKTCQDRAIDASRRLIDDVMKNLDTELYGHANQAVNLNEHQLCMDAHGMIKDHQAEYTERFMASVTEQISQLQEPEPQTEIQDETLALLGNEELEDWISISEISNYAESRLKAPLTELEHRLSYLTGRAIDHQNNPFGPHVFAQAFQQILNPIQPGRAVRQISFNVFKLLLTSWMEGLCRDLNGYLIERGILPDIKQTIIRADNEKRAHTQRQRGEQKKNAAAGTDFLDETVQQSSDSSSVDPENLTDQSAGVPAADSVTSDWRSRETGGDNRNLYQLVRDLRSLQQQFGHVETAPVGASPPQPIPADTLNSEEILAALSRLQHDQPSAGNPIGGAASMQRSSDLRRRILSVVSGPDGGSRGKVLGSREAGIIDVADTLFSSMQGDSLVAESVRSWLRRLEVPLLKLAMLDESLFLDHKHAARKVVNRIAKLELYDGGQDNTGSALHREVDKLIDYISSEDKPDATVFNKVLKKLDLLIKVQDEAYTENLKEVLASCETEQTTVIEGTAVPLDDSDSEAPDEDHRQWLKRIARMKVGDWVLSAADPARPQRLRLAWISIHHDRYVFVNVRGQKEANYHIDELAVLFANGDAAIMDSADEPALDRAQYTMLQNLQRQLLHETTHDQLTGLNNRREFERHLQELLEKTRCTDIKSSLIHVDLAQFNTINNTCGYEGGDKALTEIAQLLGRTVPSNAVTGRIGSDEFGILLEGVSHEETLSAATAVLDGIRDYKFLWHDETFVITAGIGIVYMEEFENASEVMQAAESSCRSSRSQGVNQMQVYQIDDPSQLIRTNTARWLSRIDKALNEDTLELRCQRIMPIAVQDSMPAPHHSEVLLGITDESGSLISPQEFIITAEHFQRMPAIDRWVVSKMFRFIVENRGTLDKVGGFAINLSGCSLSDDSFKDFIRDEIAKTAVPMENVCFEITETAGITCLSDAAQFIEEIKETGCSFSLDDFGSGLSSYVYLKNLPVDYLKIDGSFVREMDQNPADFAVVKSITEIGHFMAKKVIAESVESEIVLDQLREIGVDFVQGYAIERPMRLSELQ